ncbi:MAG: hypothetical protein J0M02_02705 [Planctomycetes bacterium]|nr:hypothetical protein [Planctomycetota bacterium]
MLAHGRRVAVVLAASLLPLAGAETAAGVPAPDAAAVRAQTQDGGLGPAMDDARFLLAAGRTREAVGRLTDALAAATGTDRTQRTEAEALLARCRAAEGVGDTAGAVADRRTAQDDAVERSRRTATVAGDQRRERLARIADLRARGLRELALAHCRKLMSDLPGDEEVDVLFRDLLNEAHAARSTAIAERERELREEVAQLVERSLIPEGFDGQPVFPSDWATRHADRDGLLEVREKPAAWFEQLSDRLAERASVSFDATPVAEALELVSKLGGVNIVTAPEILAATDRTVTLRAAGMRLDSLLTWITEQAGTRWSLSNGAIFVGEQVETQRSTAIHDIGELLVGTGDFPGPQIAFTSGNGTNASVFSAPTESGVAPPTADDVADLIRRSVSPRTWDDQANAIIVRSRSLLITAPESVQRLVREFLRAQSAQRSLSVRLETRWLELSDGYAEQIGVEWTSGTGQLVDPDMDGSGFVRSSNGWGIDGGTRNVLPGTSVAYSPALDGSGLTLQSALLGSSKFSAILHATERNQQGRVLQAPELTCMNGQRAHAFFGRQVAYIADYEISNNRYDLVVDVLNTGVSIEVRPLVSADRKYVTLELRSTVADVSLFTDYITVANPDETSGVDVDGDGIVDIVFGMPLVYPIELPNVTVRSVGTSVMMPDRGSLLVGGFGHSIDEFSATRVPFLGSIPFLGRLFGARGRYASRSNLYLLTTATIINYPELEARL